jgi:hypothetical protein
VVKLAFTTTIALRGVAISLLVMLAGCLSYANRLSLHGECRVDAEGVRRILEPTLLDRGFARHEDFLDDSGPEYAHHIVAHYYWKKRATSSDRVWVMVTETKDTRQAGVLVRDLDSSRASQEVLDLEDALATAIQTAIAGCRTVRAPEVWGPGFGP